MIRVKLNMNLEPRVVWSKLIISTHRHEKYGVTEFSFPLQNSSPDDEIAIAPSFAVAEQQINYLIQIWRLLIKPAHKLWDYGICSALGFRFDQIKASSLNFHELANVICAIFVSHGVKKRLSLCDVCFSYVTTLSG